MKLGIAQTFKDDPIIDLYFISIPHTYSINSLPCSGFLQYRMFNWRFHSSRGAII